MPLIELWRSAPDTVANLTLQQVVSNAGDGDLRDNTLCSSELRTFLAETATEKLATYVNQCLTNPPTKGGLILQDLINELGRRLDYDVEHGRYVGVSGQIGFDGLWFTKSGPALIIEVKTTDAYRLSLDSLIEYRRKLVGAGKCGPNASILIVVGRQDTGELEAQVRGSRHAWDVRLISAEALLRLVEVKERSEQKDVVEKIRGLLRPAEYTRLDWLVDVVFSASRDREEATIEPSPEELTEPNAITREGLGGETEKAAPSSSAKYQFTAAADIAATRHRLINTWSGRIGAPLVAKSPAQFRSADNDHRVVCSISKRYTVLPGRPYWYAYHPAWREFLTEVRDGTLLLGAMDLDRAFAISASNLEPVLPNLNTTVKPDGKTYWHLHILEDASNGFSLYVPGREPVRLEPLSFALD